jgi:hypothetical protein
MLFNSLRFLCALCVCGGESIFPDTHLQFALNSIEYRRGLVFKSGAFNFDCPFARRRNCSSHSSIMIASVINPLHGPTHVEDDLF